MKQTPTKHADGQDRLDTKPRPMRVDAHRKMSALLEAAMEVFQTSGVDARVREIAEKAGVGLGTVYRHFRDGRISSRRCFRVRSMPAQMRPLTVQSIRAR